MISADVSMLRPHVVSVTAVTTPPTASLTYWRGRCNCGWRSAEFSSELLAADRAETHIYMVHAGMWAGNDPTE